nr:hypothetical protein [Tanacetum cinerariifolium]
MLFQAQADIGEGSTMPTTPQHTPPIIQPITSKPKKKQKPRKPRRQDTKLPQTCVPTKTVADEFVNEEMYDSLERGTTTATSLDAEHDRGNINKTQSKVTPNEPCSLGTSSGGGPRRQDTMGDTIAQIRVIDLEKTKTIKAQEILRLKNKVKRLEKKRRSRTYGLKRLYKIGLSARVESSTKEQILGEEDASKQGINIADIDAYAKITLVDETLEDQERQYYCGIKETVSTAALITTVNVTPDELTMAQALVEIKKSKPKGATTTTTTTVTIPTPNSTRPKARGVVILQVEFDEQDKLAEEKSQQIEDENLAWDNVQAMMDVDYELVARLQEEEQRESTIEEKSILFMELMDKRKKHFAKLKAEEKRRKPLTKAKKRNQISKRAGDDLDQERSKKQKVEDDKESKELKRCLEIILDDGDDVTIDATPLYMKTPIIDYKIYKERKKSYF